MEKTAENDLAIEKYSSLVAKLYRKPVDCIFNDVTRAILGELEDDSSDKDSDASGSESQLDQEQESTADSTAAADTDMDCSIVSTR